MNKKFEFYEVGDEKNTQYYDTKEELVAKANIRDVLLKNAWNGLQDILYGHAEWWL